MAGRRELSGDEAKALLSVVADYSFALDLLDDYDHQRVAVSGTTPGAVKPLDYDEARRMVDRLREKFGTSALFGREKDDSLKGALGAVMQTFGGKDLYPSWRKRPRICSISWSKIIPLWTATSGSAPPCSCGFWKRTVPCTDPTAPSASPTQPSLP